MASLRAEGAEGAARAVGFRYKYKIHNFKRAEGAEGAGTLAGQ